MECLKTKIDSLILYLTPWQALISSHMVSFLTQNLWSKHIPQSIREEFETLCPVDCHAIFYSDSRVENKEIYKFISEAEEKSKNDFIMGVNELKDKIKTWGFNDFKKLECGMQFMSSKKNHEVEVMSEIVAAMASVTDSKLIVDVGDGKGYLSSILNLEYDINVLGIDASSVNTTGATKRVQKMKKQWNGIKKNMKIITTQMCSEEERKSTSRYHCHTKYIDIDTDIKKLVLDEFSPDITSSYGLVGLHTCGKLSPVCLKQFANNSSCSFLINVGCCYHLLDEGDSGDFPMSEYLKNANFKLGRNARMLSLQAPARISSSKNIKTESVMFRAVLEKLLMEKTSYTGHPQVEIGRISSKCKNFVEYIRKAISKTPFEINMSDEEINYYLSSQLHLELRLQFYFMVRVFLAPVIEKIILYDRLLYLKEQVI